MLAVHIRLKFEKKKLKPRTSIPYICKNSRSVSNYLSRRYRTDGDCRSDFVRCTAAAGYCANCFRCRRATRTDWGCRFPCVHLRHQGPLRSKCGWCRGHLWFPNLCCPQGLLAMVGACRCLLRNDSSHPDCLIGVVF